MGKCNLYLEMWERVYLLSGKQPVNSDKNLNKKNKTIGKLPWQQINGLWTQVLQPAQPLNVESDSTLSKEHDICDYYW